MSHKICYVGNMSIRLKPKASAGSVFPYLRHSTSSLGFRAVEIAVQNFRDHSFVSVKGRFLKT